jgi:large subunit ribosomal protein L15
MQINELKRKNKNKKDRIVGRGGKHAKTSGRGGKGQTARAGNKRRPELRVIIKKFPKLRGYRFNSYQTKPKGVSLLKISKAFKAGSEVNPNTLIEARLVSKVKGIIPKIKILNSKEDFNVKLTFSKVLFSTEAKEKVVKAGGSIVE